jgi:hypothetical protein
VITKQIQDLEEAVLMAYTSLAAVRLALENAQELPENNVFESMDDAKAKLRGDLYTKAEQDCESLHNGGKAKYEREFMVDDVVYIATLDVEYNRHDKTYYFIEESEFSITVKA